MSLMNFDEIHRTLLYADQLGNPRFKSMTQQEIQNTPDTERVWRPEWKSDADRIRDVATVPSINVIFQERQLGYALSPNEHTLKGAELSHAYWAYEFRSKEVSRVIMRRIWSGQKFAPSATPWELKRSLLAQQVVNLGGTLRKDGVNTANLPLTASGQWFSPLVVPGKFQNHASVVGHVGVVNGTDLIAPEKMAAGSAYDVFARGMLFVAEDTLQSRPPKGWRTVGFSSHTYAVVTTPDGQVASILGTSDGDALKKSLDIVEFAKDVAKWVYENKWEIALSILLPEVLPAVVALAARGRQTIMALVASVRGSRAARALLAGATPELAATVEAEALIAKGVYNEAAGITRVHHQAFMDAAAETELAIAVRHTNPKSIKLIEMRCPGKPKNLEFINTSPDTGIVMATKAEDVLRAQRLNYYVVGDGNKATRLVMRGGAEVSEEVSLNSTFWKLEKGQVIDPKVMKPIVGDYDLMGVWQVNSPGRNIGLVTRNYGEMVTDVTNPIVQKAASAVNPKFDMPRVLHGAQDMYKGFRKGVSVYLPDRTVLHFESEEAVKAYYASIGRETRIGMYPRPSLGTPVTDELAARRKLR